MATKKNTRKPDHRDIDEAARKSLETAVTGFYAAAGAADAFYEIAKERLEAVQTQLDERRRRREKQADDMRRFVTGLPEQAKGVQTDQLLADLTARYNEMAGRGRKVVDRLVKQVDQTSNRMAADAENVRDTARETVSPLVDGARQSAGRARKVAEGESAATSTPQTSTRRQAAARRSSSSTTRTSAARPAGKKPATSSTSTAGKPSAAKSSTPRASNAKASAAKASNAKASAAKAAASKQGETGSSPSAGDSASN